ncbi:MAG: acyl-ACP--UDP-N-acetylglucosamine O-acyltransferase [Planctomycetota bacterium]
MGVVIEGTAVVDPAAELGDGVQIGAGCYVGAGVVIGDRTVLMAGACVYGPSVLGKENVIYPRAVLGTGPQDLGYRGEPTRLEVGDGNEFREFVSVNRGTVKGGGITRVGHRGLFMACSHIAHDCQVGDRVVMANSALLAGHVHVGDGAVINGAAAFHHFVSVGRMAYVGGMSRVVHDVPPFVKVEGNPARVRMLNAVGLRRQGLDAARIEALDGAVRRLFRGHMPLRVAVEEIEREVMTDDVRHLVDCIKRSMATRKGRYLEEFRKQV